MTFKNVRLAGTASVLVLVGLMGCDTRSPDQTGQSASSVAASPATAEENSEWQCPASPGTAPSGQLTAERIPGSASKREQAGLYEGPVWIDGSLYFSDFTFEEGFPSRVQRLTSDGTLETAIEDSGSNGLAVDSQGFLMAATHDAKAISRYELSTGEREIVWSEFEGNPFNSPNDLTLTDEGVIYFTDPAFQRAAAPGGQPQTRVYRIDESGISVIESDIENPNGVSLSPDEKTLYVAGGGQNGVLRAYSLTESGAVEGHRDLARIEIPDGMAVDCLGNIYVTEHALQRVRVFSPEGDQIAEIRVDANITNAAFGGPERKTLYLTGAGTLWQIPLEVAGFPY